MRNIALALLSVAATAGEHTLKAWSESKSFGEATRRPVSLSVETDINAGYELPLEFADNDVDLEWHNSLYANSVVTAVFSAQFLNEALSTTWFGLGGSASFTIFEFYGFDNVITYFYKERTFCDKLSWYYDVLQLAVDVSVTFNECIFGAYDYYKDDGVTCASTTYTLDDIYTLSVSDRLNLKNSSGEGWYGINTCDEDSEPTEPTVEEPTEETTTEETTDETIEA